MKHVNFDSNGNEYRVYSSIPGCACPWCQSQRAESRRHYSITGKVDCTAEEAGKLLDVYARNLMRADNTKSYSAALRDAFTAYPMVAELYTGMSADNGDPNDNVDRGPEQAGAELADLAKARQREANIPYTDALHEVLKEHPALAERYDGISTRARDRIKRK